MISNAHLLWLTNTPTTNFAFRIYKFCSSEKKNLIIFNFQLDRAPCTFVLPLIDFDSFRGPTQRRKLTTRRPSIIHGAHAPASAQRPGGTGPRQDAAVPPRRRRRPRHARCRRPPRLYRRARPVHAMQGVGVLVGALLPATLSFYLRRWPLGTRPRSSPGTPSMRRRPTCRRCCSPVSKNRSSASPLATSTPSAASWRPIWPPHASHIDRARGSSSTRPTSARTFSSRTSPESLGGSPTQIPRQPPWARAVQEVSHHARTHALRHHSREYFVGRSNRRPRAAPPPARRLPAEDAFHACTTRGGIQPLDVAHRRLRGALQRGLLLRQRWSRHQRSSRR